MIVNAMKTLKTLAITEHFLIITPFYSELKKAFWN